MKKIVLVVAAVFVVSTLFGCGKKKKSEEAVLDNMTNGVVSENIVSVTDQTGSDAIPVVVVDNSEALPQVTGDMAPGVEVNTDKPTTRQIQQALKNAGFYAGNIDGNIGPKTKRAIEEFQSQNGLKVDGKVGPKTWGALAAYLTETAEVNNPIEQVQTVGRD